LKHAAKLAKVQPSMLSALDPGKQGLKQLLEPSLTGFHVNFQRLIQENKD